MGVDSSLKLFDLTHEIPAYQIWDAAYRLDQTIGYWPKGTVFVSVVDPGVGTNRKSIVAKTKKGHFVVTPDNGTITLLAQSEGFESIREIDETKNRRKGSEQSYTFHGRDVYAYTASRLASQKISFDEVGPVLQSDFVKLPYQTAQLIGNKIMGSISALDVQYGNIWSNISDSIFKALSPQFGDVFEITIRYLNKIIFLGSMPYVSTFGAVKKGAPLVYLNSLMNVSVALNMDDFAAKHHINHGGDWQIEIKKTSSGNRKR